MHLKAQLYKSTGEKGKGGKEENVVKKKFLNLLIEIEDELPQMVNMFAG